MDITTTKTDLLAVLPDCVSIAEKKSAMPALANVLLACDGDRLRVSATDHYLSFSDTLPADIATAGSVAVPAKDLYERIKSMPAGPIRFTVETESSKLTVRSVGTPRRFILHGIPGGEFPTLPQPAHDAPAFELPAPTIARLIACTGYAVSADETRPHVNSLNIEVDRCDVLAVSTDGHRLAKCVVTTASPVADRRVSMLLPLAAMHALTRIVDGVTGAVAILQSGANVFFRVGTSQFSAKLVDAQFPPWKQVVPTSTSHTARAPRAGIVDMLKAMKIAAPDRTGGVKLAFAPGTLRITGESPESGNGFDEIAVDYAGEPMTIGVNADYLIAALAPIACDEVLLGVSGELDPMLITPGSEPAGESYVAVAMPMRLT